MDNALWDNQMVSYPPEHLTSAPSSYSSNSRNTSPKGRFDQTAQPTSLVPQGGFAYKTSQYQSLPVTSTQIKNTQYTTFSAPLSGPKQTGLLVPPKHIRRAVADIYTVAVQPTEDPRNQSLEKQVAKSSQTSLKPQRQTQNSSSTARNIATARQTPNSSSSAVVSSTKFPKYLNYTTTASRLDSFKACQNIAASTRILSEAGFFYAGTEDCTRCFYCGIGLRNWSENDDPWTEHARFSLDCDHVVSEKGREFVNLVKLALELTNERNEVSLVFLPCGHLVSCNTCGNRQKSCVTCGQNVKGTVRTYNA
ncbi:IAP3-like protein [Mya arenaria]|uniref:IAP3-like protein n=1 Tax=Mya arenaria TaxID=6604 RepID=A0ABY7F339_MYAAR|nr:IAP3-like protein [Mya arenaria]